MNPELLDILEKGLVIDHPIFKNVREKVLRKIQRGRKDQPICIFGPTGNGKTTLQKHLIDLLIQRQNEGWKPGLSPPVSVEAPAQHKGGFLWREFMEGIAIELGETDFQSKIDIEQMSVDKKAGITSQSSRNATFGVLEKTLRKRVNAVRPVAIFIDEAQNIVEGLAEKSRKSNVNRLKNWANTMDTKIILFGTHEAKDFLNVNEQLSRRISPIYFPRYRGLEEDEYTVFYSFFITILASLEIPVQEEVKSVKNFRYIYNHSLGSPGLLVSWLHDAIAYCIDRKITKLSLKVLRKEQLTKDRLRTIELAIKRFEAYYESIQGEFDPNEVYPEPWQLDLDEQPQLSPKVGKARHQPGKQLPKRHPVHANQ